MAHRQVSAYWLGRRPYGPIHTLQERLVEARKAQQIGDTLLLLEHQPVITFGRGAKDENLLASPELLQRRGVELCRTGRGGDVTYHGPGQLVAYPIVDLSPDRCDVRKYVGDLCKVMIQLAADQGISAGPMTEHVGVWVDNHAPKAWPGEENAKDPAKIGAIGVRISKWVTMHGFAFNAQTDMDAFSLIVPCGIREHGVTSLQKLNGTAPSPKELAPRAADIFCSLLQAELASFETLPGPDDKLLESFGLLEAAAC